MFRVRRQATLRKITKPDVTSGNFTIQPAIFNPGFTLIEVLVALSILLIVFTVTFGAMRIYDISLTMGSSKSQISAQANLALNKIASQLSLSNRSVVVNLTPALTTNPSNEISFRIPIGLDNQQNIIWGDDENNQDYQIRYYLGNLNKPNQLIKQRLDNLGIVVSESILANDITSLQLTLNGNSVTIDVGVGKGIQHGIVPDVRLSSSTSLDFKN